LTCKIKRKIQIPRPLRIVRKKPLPEGKEVPWRDANDLLSSFPDAKIEQREPTPGKREKKNSGKYR